MNTVRSSLPKILSLGLHDVMLEVALKLSLIHDPAKFGF